MSDAGFQHHGQRAPSPLRREERMRRRDGDGECLWCCWWWRGFPWQISAEGLHSHSSIAANRLPPPPYRISIRRNTVCVCDITAFHEILIDPASCTQRGRERTREGKEGGEDEENLGGGGFLCTAFIVYPPHHHYHLPPSLLLSTLPKKNLFHLFSDHDHSC